MCRLLGVVGSRPISLKELLADDAAPFAALAAGHADGWGAAHVGADDRIAMEKEPVRADRSDAFASHVDETVTDAALLHIRHASPGQAVVPENTHPFGSADGAFAHSGYFAPADIVDNLIRDDLLAGAGGTTDSERFSLAVRSRVEDGVEPAKAITWAAGTIRVLATEWVSLNCLYLSADALYAYSDYEPRSETVTRSGPDFFHLNYRVESDRVVVASTGWNRPQDQWRRLPCRRVLEIRRRDLSMVLHGD